MMRVSVLRLSPVLVLAAALVALVVFLLHDTPPVAQAQSQETTIWSATLTVADRGWALGCDETSSGAECSDNLTVRTFTSGGADYQIEAILVNPATEQLHIQLNKTIPYGLRNLTLSVDGLGFVFADGKASTATNTNDEIIWDNTGLSWSAGDSVELSLVEWPLPGDLDFTFSSASAITTKLGDGHDRAYAMAVQSDGKIVVAGQSHNGSNDDFALARYTAAGVLDTAFGTDGKVTTPIGSGDDEAHAVAIQSDGKIVVVGQSHNGSNPDFAVARYDTAGALDTTFGADGADSDSDPDGYVTTGIQNGYDFARAVAIQSDGKIVVVGVSHNGSNNDFAVARYTTAGALDTTFGTDGADSDSDPDGYVTTGIQGSDDEAHAVAIQSDGKIVVVGYSGDGSTWDFALARYTTAGVLDNSFDSDGKVTTGFGTTAHDYARAVAIQSDGKIVVAGDSDNDGISDNFAVARYTAAGALDTTFGADGADAGSDPDGYVTTDIRGSDDEAHAVAIQSDGKIVAVGNSVGGGTRDFAAARYTTAGVLDTSFSGDGKVATAIGTGHDYARAVAIRSDDGHILAAGYSSNGTNDDFALAAYDADGEPADILDGPGWVSTNVGSGLGGAFGTALQPDGKIVAVGYNSTDFTVARYTTAGALDTTFGTDGADAGTDPDGYVNTAIGSGLDIGYDVALQSDGKIVVAGITHNGSDFDFAVARYTTAGALDTTFGTDGADAGSDPDGFVTTAIGSGADRLSTMALQSDGKIVVAGRSYNGTNDDFVVARYTTAGVLDTTFGTDHDSSGSPDGYVTSTIGSGEERIYAMALQPDGKIVVAGYSNNGSNDDFAVARYTTAGVLDTTFGTDGADAGNDPDGYVTTAVGSGDDQGRAIGLQSDGKIVVVGHSNNGSNDDFAVARYTTAGALDTTFGTDGADAGDDPDGYVTTAIGSGTDAARATSIQSDGKIVVVGHSANDFRIEFALARYTRAGALDATFGTGGKVTTAIGYTNDSLLAVALQSDGKIVAAGSHQTGEGASDFAVARYHSVPPDPDLLRTLTVESSLDGGSFSALTGAQAMVPTFDYATTGYRATVGNDTTHVRLTPTVAVAGSPVQVGKQGTTLTTVASGSASGAIALDVGDNAITVRVNNTKDYTVTVRRVPSGTVWESTLAVKALGSDEFGCNSLSATAELKCATADTLTDDDFTVGGRAYEIDKIGDRLISAADSFEVVVDANTNAELRGLTFCIGATAYPLSNATGGGQSDHREILWENTDVGWSAADAVSLSIGTTCGPTYEFSLNDSAVPPGVSHSLTVELSEAAPAGGLELTLTPLLGAALPTGLCTTGAATVLAEADDIGSNPPTTVTVQGGQTTASFNYPTADNDDPVYRTECFGLQLGTSAGGWTAGDNAGVIKLEIVRKNSAIAMGSNGGATTKYTATVAENVASGTLSVPVTVAHLPYTSESFAIEVLVGGSATENTDFSISNKSVTFGPSMAKTQNLTVTITNDVAVESDETIELRVAAPGGSATLLNEAYRRHAQGRLATITINSEDAVPGSVRDLTIASEDTKLDVSWRAPTSAGSSAVTGYDVHYTSAPSSGNGAVGDDAAASGSDPTTAWVDASHSGTTTLSKEITSLTNGTAYRVRVRAVNAIGDGPWERGTGTPADKPSVSLSASPNPVSEGSSVTVTATLSKAHTSSVTIPLTLTVGTAETGDFGALTSITVASGQTSGTGTIRANHDGDADDETFTVALGSSLPSAVVAGSPSSVVVTITDDEKPTVRLSASPNPVEEGSAVTITATLTAALSTDATIPLTVTAGTAETSDFGTLASITVTAGQTTGTGTISTSHDAGEDDETFTVALGSSLPASVLAGSPSSVEVRITDDEGKPAVSLSASPNPVNEGSSVTVTATLSKAHTSSVTVPLTLTAGTAETGDFGRLSSIRIASGATSATGTIRANHDADIDDETFTVDLGSPLPQGTVSGSPSSVLVTITDDDKPSTNANLSRLTASSAKSARGTYTPLALSPPFSASTTSYAATVVSTVSHARLTPTVADTGKATVQVGKSGSLNRVSSGRASAAIPLDDGANAIIVRVTAEDGTTTRDYTVTITRAPRPKVSLSASPNPVTPQPDPDDPHDPPQKKAQVTITATLDRALPETVFIPVTLTQDPNPDHGVISVIGIQANALSGSHIMNVYDDVDNEDDTFTVALDTAKLPETVAAGTRASVTVTIKDTDSKAAPGQVGNFTVTPKVRYLHATWERPTARTTRYDVQFKTAAAPNQMATSDDDPSTGWVALPKGGAYAPDFTDRRITILPGGLTSGTAYDVRVRAVNWKATGPWATGRGTPR